MKLKLLFLFILLATTLAIPTTAQTNKIQHAEKTSTELTISDTSSKKSISTHLLKTSGQTSSELGVYNWLDNNPSATVLTFDDFSPGHPAIGIPDLIKHNLVGTFFVTINNAWRSDDYSIMMNAVTKGIEIGNHTITHPDLTTLSASDLNKEINNAYDTLNKYVFNQKVHTLAYPFGAYDDNVISVVKQHHIAARHVSKAWGGWNYDFAQTAKDYYAIPTVAVNSSMTKKGIADNIEQGINDGGLMTFMIHSIYSENISDTWFDGISQDLYNSFLDTVAYYSDKTWVTTFSNAIRYHKEAKSATLKIESNNSTQTILSLTDTLANNSIYNQPLSIYYNPTLKSVFTSVKQNGIELAFKQTNGLITFNAIPDGGNIVLTKDASTSIDLSTYDLFNAVIYPMPTSGRATLEFSVNPNEQYFYKLIDAQGKVISVSESTSSVGSDKIRQEIYVQAKGFYFVEIHINNKTKTIKMVVE